MLLGQVPACGGCNERAGRRGGAGREQGPPGGRRLRAAATDAAAQVARPQGGTGVQRETGEGYGEVRRRTNRKRDGWNEEHRRCGEGGEGQGPASPAAAAGAGLA